MNNEFEDTLIKIKLLIDKYYENIGRYGEVSDVDMEELIADIDNMLNDTKLNKKKLILTKLEEEEENE